jgi:hypothetical protein
VSCGLLLGSQILGERGQHLEIVSAPSGKVLLAESRPREAGRGLVDPRCPSCRWSGCFDRPLRHGVASPRIPRRHFQVLHFKLWALLRRAGSTQRRSVSSFCLCSCAVPWGDSVAEFILKLLSSTGGKTRTGSHEHSGPVWQSERKVSLDGFRARSTRYVHSSRDRALQAETTETNERACLAEPFRELEKRSLTAASSAFTRTMLAGVAIRGLLPTWPPGRGEGRHASRDTELWRRRGDCRRLPEGLPG